MFGSDIPGKMCRDLSMFNASMKVPSDTPAVLRWLGMLPFLVVLYLSAWALQCLIQSIQHKYMSVNVTCVCYTILTHGVWLWAPDTERCGLLCMLVNTANEPVVSVHSYSMFVLPRDVRHPKSMLCPEVCVILC
jgi:hypothetical protein